MKAVKNIEGKALEFSFEGYTYNLSREKAVLVEEDLYEHMKEACPLAVKEIKTKKKLTRIKKVKTRSYIRPEPQSTYQPNDMKTTKAGHQVSTFAEADITPKSGTVDKDGVGWYGEGVTIENI